MPTGSMPSESGRRPPPSRAACIFCDIISGRAPASRILETRRVLVLIPIRPKSDGHCLVVPKQHATRLDAVDDDTLREMAIVVKRLAKAMHLRSYNVLQNSGPESNDAGVPHDRPFIEHVHVHLIPRQGGDGIRVMDASSTAPSREMLDRMAARVRRKLRQARRSAP